ncbi:MAG: hypothetical protein HGA94_02660 [Candidatus Aminicenantes bacterium]|nr:hypothetical protein [Candidatus Aminicenantes bacterium]
MTRLTAKNARPDFRTVTLPAILALAALVPSLSAKETFKARMLTGKGSFDNPQINVRIEVESWTTPEEINQLQAALNQGFGAFETAFTAAKKGIAKFMSPQGRGLTIHVALSIPKDNGRRILLFFNFQPWDAGSQFMASFSANFMVMDFTLDENGGGDGHFYEFAEVKLRPEQGAMEMLAFSAAPKTLPIVQETTKKKK